MRHQWRVDMELKLNQVGSVHQMKFVDKDVLMKMASSGIWGFGWVVGGARPLQMCRIVTWQVLAGQKRLEVPCPCAGLA